ncbi:MAG TPA: hypothetical protein DFI00_03520 [Rhodospirillaceae bacterium]|nr:hypothetical protein [Alphaproteobacteria bacterium]OUT40996.1 MAG: hypothetical protein CBB62_01095 [Micavibrio sp. TMED2]HCI46343.1 hypothetical protein [Rhodospirillaceae bacterium]MAS47514.1 hypothetical protein [Alphaproteobacteria bacterium]MAX96613.1 hypothetical protein [Alphaproteobacteria bacterium]|tara:strand:- start:1603 stop:2451 length:849 start_codon:yes stop_codon:yes gene_type:complete
MDLAAAEALLRAAGQQDDEALDLLQIAGAFALFDLGTLEEPVPLDPYQRHLNEMATAIRHAMPDGEVQADLSTHLAAMRSVVIEAEGYRGDEQDYDAMHNANILSVIERRRGLPVAIGLICLALADRLGWQMAGLNFPGHFLLQLTVGRERAVIDPFDGLTERQPGELRLLLKAHRGPDAEFGPTHEQVVSRRDVLMRLRNNVKIRQLQADNEDAALSCVEQMVWLNPMDSDLRREAAMLNIRVGKLQHAIDALEAAALVDEDPQASAEAASLARELRHKLN